MPEGTQLSVQLPLHKPPLSSPPLTAWTWHDFPLPVGWSPNSQHSPQGLHQQALPASPGALCPLCPITAPDTMVSTQTLCAHDFCLHHWPWHVSLLSRGTHHQRASIQLCSTLHPFPCLSLIHFSVRRNHTSPVDAKRWREAQTVLSDICNISKKKRIASKG